MYKRQSYGFLAYLAVIIALAASYFLNHTRKGLHLRAVGENPNTADAVGINVSKYKYVATCVGCMIAVSYTHLEAACELADAGCNFIFADSFGHEDYMIEAAKEYPEVQFSHATGTKAHTENLDNFHNAFASIYDGRYLAGIAAGMKLNEMIDNGDITAEQAKIGYVGAFTYAEVISGYTSFFLSLIHI